MRLPVLPVFDTRSIRPSIPSHPFVVAGLILTVLGRFIIVLFQVLYQFLYAVLATLPSVFASRLTAAKAPSTGKTTAITKGAHRWNSVSILRRVFELRGYITPQTLLVLLRAAHFDRAVFRVVQPCPRRLLIADLPVQSFPLKPGYSRCWPVSMRRRSSSESTTITTRLLVSL